MNEFIKSMDELSLTVKIVLALPFLDIIWVVYRLIKSLTKQNALGIVLAIVMLIVGIPFVWIIDIVTLATQNKILWLD